MTSPTDRFTLITQGYKFTNLTTTSAAILTCLFQGCKWFFSFTTPDGDIGSFELISGYDSATSKFTYVVADTCNITAIQSPAGTITITVTGYATIYKITVDLDNGNAVLDTDSGTATGDTEIKIIQVA